MVEPFVLDSKQLLGGYSGWVISGTTHAYENSSILHSLRKVFQDLQTGLLIYPNAIAAQESK